MFTEAQRAELASIANGHRDTNRHVWGAPFRDGRDHARGRLLDVLFSEDDDALEQTAIEMDSESCLFEGEFSFGFLSVLDDVRRVLPSWPWLPATLDTETEGKP